MSFPLSIPQTLIQGSSVWEGHLVRESLCYISIWEYVYPFFTSFLELICLRYEYAHLYICKIIIIITTIISTCVYVPSILHHWACISISEDHFIEYVCRWEFVCELSKTLHSLYSLCHICFLEWDMSNLLLKALVHCPFHHYIHCWCDFTSCLIWLIITPLRMFIVSLSSLLLLLIHHLRFTPLFFSYNDLFQVWYFLCIILTHLITSSIFVIASLLLLYSHWAPSSP